LRDTTDQLCKKMVVKISPQPEIINEYTDFFGNKVMYFAIQQEHKKLTVTVSSLISKDNAVVKNSHYNIISWEDAGKLFSEQRPEYFDARQYIPETEMTEISSEVREYALSSFSPGKSLFDATYDLMQRIHRDFEFKPGFTTIATPLITVMKLRKGVCQDFAHLMLQILRTLEIPCKYVSGYICPQKNGMRGEGATHAWIEAWIPGTGWTGIDPTNNVWVESKHVKLAVGRNFTDCSVVKGTYKGSAKQELFVVVSIGYEDGVTFEETNQVLIEKQKPITAAIQEGQQQQ